MLFLALLFELRGQVEKSHGLDSKFAHVVGGVIQTMMELGGKLDVQYAQMGVKRDQWPKLLEEQMKEMWPKLEAFAKDESIAAQIDEVLAE